MDFSLKVWRQPASDRSGQFRNYQVQGISPDMSFLEMLDVLNGKLLERGEPPVAFDNDCREGICGTCGFMIDGRPHGPVDHVTVCQLFMREFEDGAELLLEPFRARAFPVLRDLVVDRSAFDHIVAAGGYISANVGSAPEANSILVPVDVQARSMSGAACIACGACVATCPNASAILFTGAQALHLNVLPQGQPERYDRALRLVEAMDAEGFGQCTNTLQCVVECPAKVPFEAIVFLRGEFLRAIWRGRPRRMEAPEG